MHHYQEENIMTAASWHTCVASFPEANFLSSWEWGQFQIKMHKEVVYLCLRQNEQVVAAGVVVIEKAKRGTYLALAGGPLVDWNNTDAVTAFFAAVKQHAKRVGAVSIRFRPQVTEPEVPQAVLSALHAHLAPMHLTADYTLQLDLKLTQEQLLAQMRKTTRYEIKKAEKSGITTTLSSDPADIQRFCDHQYALAQKHGFVPFSYSFLLNQFTTFVEHDAAFLVHAWSGPTLLATAFIICQYGEAVYHYGVSTPQNDRMPGAYAAQWAAIREAQRRGCTRYNFWGITKPDQTGHRFAGVSTFKRGFGGFEVAYLPAHDIPTHWKYWLLYAFETVRRKIRRL